MLLTELPLLLILLLSGINHSPYRIPVTAASGPELRHVTPGQEEVTLHTPNNINNVPQGKRGMLVDPPHTAEDFLEVKLQLLPAVTTPVTLM
ncbi:hypothetical protein NQZ68_019902 [Dissostichus eleginoides]|nr:hypothetical protein NQZ68_019902 [Dissostichus eleginoides]